MLKRLFIGLTLLFISVCATTLLMPSSALAANCSRESNSFLGLPTWYKYLDPVDRGNGDCELRYPPGADGRPSVVAAIPRILLAVFEIVLRFAGVVAVGFVIFGGFQYMLSQGEPDKLKGARTTIINALVGVAIAISATAIVNLIANNIIQ